MPFCAEVKEQILRTVYSRLKIHVGFKNRPKTEIESARTSLKLYMYMTYECMRIYEFISLKYHCELPMCDFTVVNLRMQLIK